mmetsp:Transcript_9183/g.21889  ORF Transcript_9183/g.21889 Transcript_9183/m.21889 type:complete len:2363 (+) Transcript_9183:217-7305(+)|eukprot:CAMPEP_0113617790 /NCGR_PEP_ID=MMETSP0017_2-20120614/8979_1 /TAXON_ID=2856 /ORGANISM="Cylindrotheca closterium" /LENGTH=2362 /DNA_ID=CAMNT_0000527231 /DNA_START=171 /DNA_END=7259 /DNA_ORIENTATION=- /assembly_acc=CAM_ASM_000147
MPRRSSRKGTSPSKKRKAANDEEDDTDPMEVDDSYSENDEEEPEDEELDNDDDDDEDEEVVSSRPRRRSRSSSTSNNNSNNNKKNSKSSAPLPGRTTRRKNSREMDTDDPEEETTRRSRRSTKFQKSMKESASDSVKDLFQGSGITEKIGSNSSNSDSEAEFDQEEQDEDSSDDDAPISRTVTKSKSSKTKSKSNTNNNNSNSNNNKKKAAKDNKKPKSPARRHARNRKSISHQEEDDSDSEDAMMLMSDYESEEEDDGEGEEDMKIQRILASRTETRRKWREIGSQMNTSEVTDGSRWFQESNVLPSPQKPGSEKEEQKEEEEEDDDELSLHEERFLVKWSGLSYLHCSWETQKDLLEEIEGAKTYLSSFFRKSTNGILFSQDERKDGDYFDPGLVQIDRILYVDNTNGGGANSKDKKNRKRNPSNWQEEQESTFKDRGIVSDKADPGFEDGTGRQMLIKWESANYSDCTFEFERDLVLAEIDLMAPLESYYKRTNKPTKAQLKQRKSLNDTAMRKSYKLFGDQTDMAEGLRQERVQRYQNDLASYIFQNGGQLRDYQSEGVTWFLSNWVNRRSCIMADEMGLGKTLQTAAFVNLLVEKMHRRGPFLIVVPLSTLSHWQREFVGWTGLNTIVYHGSAEDRHQIREQEFAYPQDRPDHIGTNAIYLNKCTGHLPQTKTGLGGPWMATVVVTTPEMLVADDWAELAAVRWEVLVVDEAHRLKNHNSKLAVTLRKPQFRFNHKILLTGTPIQNDVKEFWTLLNFIDPKGFGSQDDFLEKYGDIKSKDRIDELHERIRPYILRRLKEDVEKSVPPKEETLIEVELTVLQKQYYRALYEKNVKFLHKNKKKALDGPSLNNLAMQLRKCCNHVFLLNGVEEEVRHQQPKNVFVTEADFLSKGSGKFVLLDKLLPRLKENGHRVLLFSQFKIMLDILEDYLHVRSMKFERIDGSITGQKRQAAIDRFQDKESKDPPFIMLLSTRAGGVGINLTAADTCIIFDSDWNPQNDLQAQARCHRIGQTKSVKIYRLLSRKTYEMQMFHMSSLKMGLDQAVLKGFESGNSGEGTMTKEEVEKLLRHGAYDIFNEDKAGSAEAESNDFVEQDIDSILARRSRTVVHENTGSGSGAAGGTFSKASFIAKTPSKKGGQGGEDIDIEDPEFWTKMVGEAKEEVASELKPRKRSRLNYAESSFDRNFQEIVAYSDSDGEDSDDTDDDDDDFGNDAERSRWGGKKPGNWTRPQAGDLLECMEQYGYNSNAWNKFSETLSKGTLAMLEEDIQRMSWSLVLIGIGEVSHDSALMSMKHAIRSKKRQQEKNGEAEETTEPSLTESEKSAILETTFGKFWKSNHKWAGRALVDAVAFATTNEPRPDDPLADKNTLEEECSNLFYSSVWPSLSGRGWKEESSDSGTKFVYKTSDKTHKYSSPSAVLNEIVRIHPELAKMVIPVLNSLEQKRMNESKRADEERVKYTGLNDSNIGFKSLKEFLRRYAPLQLLSDRKRQKRLTIGRRFLAACYYNHIALALVNGSNAVGGDSLKDRLKVDARATLPHALWNSSHDVVLVEAIAKHGWVDRDQSWKAIADDPEIKWGFPFGEIEDKTAEAIAHEEFEQKNIRLTATRAASFIDMYSEIIDDLKGCNRTLIIESYGLKRSVAEGESGEDGKWGVDEDILLQAMADTNGAKRSEPLDLPPKKDLSRRAKTVLQKSIEAHESGLNAPPEDPKEEEQNYGYTTIDQGDACCILLAEMLRGIAKGSATKLPKQTRLMFSVAHAEAVELEKMFSASFKTTSKALEMRKIISHIEKSQSHIASEAVPSKNILRVMLGMEPTTVRSGNAKTDAMFPSAELKEKTGKPKAQAKRESHRREDGALGEKAIVRGLKKAYDKCASDGNDGSPCKFSKSGDNEHGLQLTMIETMMLLTFCSEGIPWELPVDAFGGFETFTWKSVASLLEHTIKDSFHSSTEKVKKCKTALAKLKGTGKEQETALAVRRLKVAEAEAVMKEEAAQHAVDYAGETTKFARKSIMLLEKVRKYGFVGYNYPAKFSNKVENGLGNKVQAWFGKELAKLAVAWEVADDLGGTRPLTTQDMFELNVEDAKNATVASYFDKRMSRQIVSQIAMLAKVRSVWSSSKEEDLKEKVANAAKLSRKHEDVWEKRPEWWDDSSNHNFLMLDRLFKHGFSNFGNETSGFGPADAEGLSLKQLNLTKSIVQQRANQLVRELHQSDETEETRKLLHERRKRSSSSYDKSLVECGKGKSKSKGRSTPKKSAGAKKTATIQTALHSFFKQTKSGSKKQSVVEVLDDNSDSSSSSGKRKQADESPSPSKKAKVGGDVEVVRVKPAFDEAVSNSLASSNGGAVRTRVNSQGEIEVVTVRE